MFKLPLRLTRAFAHRWRLGSPGFHQETLTDGFGNFSDAIGTERFVLEAGVLNTDYDSNGRFCPWLEQLNRYSDWCYPWQPFLNEAEQWAINIYTVCWLSETCQPGGRWQALTATINGGLRTLTANIYFWGANAGSIASLEPGWLKVWEKPGGAET